MPKQVLIFAEDPAVRRTKQLVLEQGGYSVIAVRSVRELEYVVARAAFDLAIISRTVAPPHKVAAAKSLRLKVPELPILEICNHEKCIDDPDYVLHMPNPEELLKGVDGIFSGKIKSAKT